MNKHKNQSETVNRITAGMRIAVITGAAYITGVLFGVLTGYGITGIDMVLPFIMIAAGFLLAWLTVRRKGEESILWISGKEFLDEWRNPGQKTAKTGSLCIGTVFALTMAVGDRIDMDERVFGSIGWPELLKFAVLTVIMTALFFLLFLYTDKISGIKPERKESAGKSGSAFITFCGRHVFLCSSLLYFLAYLPYYLTFFPGNSGRDTMESIDMVLGNIPWTNHQPILFTAMIGVFIRGTAFLGSRTVSLGLFALFQMITMALFLGVVTKRIFDTKTPAVLKGFAVCMFAFHPIVAMYSIYLSKDVLFSEVMILLCFCIYDMVKSGGELLLEPAFCVRLSLLTVLSALLRNNGLYIAIVLLVVLPFIYKKYAKQLVTAFGFAVAVMLLWQGPAFRLMGIEKESFAEAASVPLQQLGWVIVNDGEFSKEDRAFLEELMPFEEVKKVFTPGYTDPYKFDKSFDDAFLNENVGQFLKVWWHGCIHHFPEYVKAYLMQTVGYWHYGETNSVCTQGVTENTLGIRQMDFFENSFGFSLEGLMEKLVLAGRKAPVVCMLSSMGMQMFMIALLGVQYLRRGKKGLLLFLLPFWILWGTVMVATPAFCLLRYLYPGFLMWPFFLAEFFAYDFRSCEKKENII